VPSWRRLAWRLWQEAYLDTVALRHRLSWVYPVPADSRWLGLILDLWPGGVNVSVNERFESGDLAVVQVWHAPAGLPAEFPVRVLRVTPAPGERWILACAFARESPQDRDEPGLAASA
jgi:hypothetical protein